MKLFQHKQFIIFASPCNVFIFNAITTVTIIDTSSLRQAFVKCFKYIILLNLHTNPTRQIFLFYSPETEGDCSSQVQYTPGGLTPREEQPRTLIGANWRLSGSLSTEYETSVLFLNLALRKHQQVYMLQAGDWKTPLPGISTYPRLTNLCILSSQIILPLEKSNPCTRTFQLVFQYLIPKYQCIDNYHQISGDYSNMK